jgi:hypothetical protein
MEWMRSGEGRLIAAAVLYILMWLLKAHVPIVEKWLQTDGKLNSKRKKALANVVLAMAPVAVVLTDTSQSVTEAFWLAVGTATSAGGIHSFGKALLHKPKASESAKSEPDPGEPDKESDDDGDEAAEASKDDGSADDTRRTEPAAGDEASSDES